jgi:aminomethyltransferase
MDDGLRRTALTARHEAAGAKLAGFAGWAMPIAFGGTVAEHEAVRSSVGVFDVSHLGTVWLDGTDARAAIAATFTNDPSRIELGGSQYTLCCDERGGIVDDLIVYRVAEERWLAVPNAANTSAVVAALRDAASQRTDLTIRDESADWAVLAVQGPASLELVDRVLADVGDLADVPSAAEVPYLGAVEIEGRDGPLLLCRTGYTGEVGVELVVPNALAGSLWDGATAAGAVPCGLGARDTLRLEMGYPLHGSDLSTEVSPYEARLGWAVKLDRDDFRGRDALVKAKQAGPARRLLGLRVDGRRPPRAGMQLRDGAMPVGTVTSGSYSPTLGCGIALALLDEPVGPGDRVTLDVRGTDVEVEVVKPPFVDRDPKA